MIGQVSGTGGTGAGFFTLKTESVIAQVIMHKTIAVKNQPQRRAIFLFWVRLGILLKDNMFLNWYLERMVFWSISTV
jgi:hypothetical protein